jgi:hypothetical protein
VSETNRPTDDDVDKAWKELDDAQRKLVLDLFTSLGAAAFTVEDNLDHRIDEGGPGQSLTNQLSISGADASEMIESDDLANALYDDGGIQTAVAYTVIKAIRMLTERK